MVYHPFNHWTIIPRIGTLPAIKNPSPAAEEVPSDRVRNSGETEREEHGRFRYLCGAACLIRRYCPIYLSTLNLYLVRKRTYVQLSIYIHRDYMLIHTPGIRRQYSPGRRKCFLSILSAQLFLKPPCCIMEDISIHLPPSLAPTTTAKCY